MRRITALAVVAAALALVPPALADPPTRITIVAVFDPVTYGDSDYVNGQLFGNGQAGQLVTLEQSPPPFTDWTPVAQATSDAAGYYSFKLQPSQTLQYRTSSQGVPSERTVQVSVAPRIKLKASRAGKSSIRFSGTLAPALDGQSVAIQRRGSGGWRTVTTARLQGGKLFTGRLRAHRKTILRALFATDGLHLNAVSNTAAADPSAYAANARASRAAANSRAMRAAADARGTSAAAACRAPSIDAITTRPSPPAAARTTTLRVTATMPAGKLVSIDVLWGPTAARDHFTLAPAYRGSRATFTLRHRYAQPGSYRVRVRVAGDASGCKASRTQRPLLRVVPSIAR